jgi:hypothetical protein
MTTGHTHPSEVGPGASVTDVVKQKGVSFIQSGEMRGFYVGQAEKFGPGIKALTSEDQLAAQQGPPRLFELILDDNPLDPHAFYMEREAQRLPSGGYTFKEGHPTYVDYDKAKALLQHAPTDGGQFESSVRALPDAEEMPTGIAYLRNLRIATLRAIETNLKGLAKTYSFQ